MKNELGKLFSLDGVTTVLIIDAEGHVVEGVDTAAIDERQLAAVVSFVMAESRVLATKLGRDPLTMIFVEFSDWALVSFPIREDLFLLVITKPSANIGQISYELKKNHDTIISLL